MKKPDFNIIVFLTLFLILLKGFYFYVGLTTPGGRLSFPFLTNYLNFPYWLTVFVTKISALLLKLCGYNVYQVHPANITIAGSRGVTIAWGCLGIGAMSLWLAFIIAHRYITLHQRLKWILTGLILIFIINILRIMMIALSNHYNWQYLHAFNAHTSFNILTYAIIIIMMLTFVIHYNKTKRNTHQRKNIIT